MPLMKYLERKMPRKNRRKKKEITLSKTRELGAAIDSEHLSELTEEEMENGGQKNLYEYARVKGFLYYDEKYFRPWLVKK